MRAEYRSLHVDTVSHGRSHFAVPELTRITGIKLNLQA